MSITDEFVKEVVTYMRVFEYENERGAGCAFDCDEDGTPVLKFAEARANYEGCLTGYLHGERIIDKGIRKHVKEVFLCDCGSGEVPWREYDAQGIYLCKVCNECIDDRLGRYRPEILTGYTQADVDEPIEPDGEPVIADDRY